MIEQGIRANRIGGGGPGVWKSRGDVRTEFIGRSRVAAVTIDAAEAHGFLIVHISDRLMTAHAADAFGRDRLDRLAAQVDPLHFTREGKRFDSFRPVKNGSFFLRKRA